MPRKKYKDWAEQFDPAIKQGQVKKSLKETAVLSSNYDRSLTYLSTGHKLLRTRFLLRTDSMGRYSIQRCSSQKNSPRTMPRAPKLRTRCTIADHRPIVARSRFSICLEQTPDLPRAKGFFVMTLELGVCFRANRFY